MSFFGTDKKDDDIDDKSNLFAIGLNKGMRDAEEIRHRQAEKTEKERHLKEEHHEQEVERKNAKIVHNQTVKHDLEISKQEEKDRATERDKRLEALKTD